jgi:hypothetical protein
MLFLVISQRPWQEFCSSPPHVEFVRQNAPSCPVWQTYNVVNVTDRSPTVLVGTLAQFYNISQNCAKWSSSRASVFVIWHSAIFKQVKPVVGLCLFKYLWALWHSTSLKQNLIQKRRSFTSIFSTTKKIAKQHNNDITKTRRSKECLPSGLSHVANGFTKDTWYPNSRVQTRPKPSGFFRAKKSSARLPSEGK